MLLKKFLTYKEGKFFRARLWGMEARKASLPSYKWILHACLHDSAQTAVSPQWGVPRTKPHCTNCRVRVGTNEPVNMTSWCVGKNVLEIHAFIVRTERVMSDRNHVQLGEQYSVLVNHSIKSKEMVSREKCRIFFGYLHSIWRQWFRMQNWFVFFFDCM